MQATAADSVGVNTPLRMPPMMMKTVSMPQNAVHRDFERASQRDDLALREVVPAGDVEAQKHQREAEQQRRE